MSAALTLPEPIGDGRLLLRLPTADDVDAIHAACQDPDVQHFTTVPVPYGRHDARAYVQQAEERRTSGAGLSLLVEQDGAVVASVGLDVHRRDHVGSVGYWVAPGARGRGVASDAARLLCRFGLVELGLARLELEAAVHNVGSNGVAARLGFTLEGTRRGAMLLSASGPYAQERVDANVWGLLPGELR